ncbi:putative ubiquitin-conjugating enzyme E2 25 [Cardamine amara subsp. amara]|uniref:Ubiquitin-conjugating enzyme E2 25 n=1 Tax=Cardamine amara subsp. amara TaxID=228776 RepID=A0ABD1ADD3_CARAN
MRNEGMKKGIDVSSSDSDDDPAAKASILLRTKFRSRSAHRFMRRAEKVWAVPTTEEKEDEPEKPIPEPGEQVGDIVRFGKSTYFVIDIFEKEIMELGDKVDLNFKRFNKFEAVYGDAPRDHHFYYSSCCYSSRCCGCASDNLETEWRTLERDLALKEKKGVSFFVRTYESRKDLMRVAVTVTDCYQNHSLFFFDLKFPSEYPYRAPRFFYHPYGLPLSTLETQKTLKVKLRYDMLDVFLHIQEIVLMNTNKSCQQMLDVLENPLTGFEDFVKGYFRKKAPLILRNMMEEMDLEMERERDMFWKMYIAFEDNKAYCEHLLNSDLKAELEKRKEKEYSLSDYGYSSSANYYPTNPNWSDDIKKTSKSQDFWSKLLFFQI